VQHRRQVQQDPLWLSLLLALTGCIAGFLLALAFVLLLFS
jgi:hypothetical protein